jgi:ribonuclease VapC
MIIDSSALVAILREEDELHNFTDAILAASDCQMSAGNYLETCIVIDGQRNDRASKNVDQVVLNLGIEIVSTTPLHARMARQAYRRFGKGSGHPAQLNFGDCFAYALAMETGKPLLFKGDDFAKTDIKATSG